MSTENDASVRAVGYYLAQKEDCRLGDSATARSEGCCRGHWGRPIYEMLVKGQLDAIKRLLYKNFPASHEELMAPQRDPGLFNICGEARIGITKLVPENVCPPEVVSHPFPWSTECLSLHAEFPSAGPEGPQHRAGPPQRQTAEALVAVALQLLTNALGTCQPVVDVRDHQ